MTSKDSQVLVCFEDPTGQVMQVSYKEYLNYWRLIGWTLQGPAAPLPGIMTSRDKPSGLQASLL